MGEHDDLPILDELGSAVSRAARDQDRRDRRRGRAIAPALLSAAAVAAVLLAVVLMLGGDDRSDRRTPAGGADPILHVVVEVTFARDGGTERERVESWLSGDGCRARARVERPPDRLSVEVEETPRATRSFHPGRNRVVVRERRPGDMTEISDPVADFRRLRRSGRLREDGRVRRGGDDLARYVLRDGDLRQTYLVDPARDLPVESSVREADGLIMARTRLVTYERLPAGAPRSLLALRPRPGTPVVRRGRADDGGRGPATVRQPRCSG